jgi:hypothetical protein
MLGGCRGESAQDRGAVTFMREEPRRGGGGGRRERSVLAFLLEVCWSFFSLVLRNKTKSRNRQDSKRAKGGSSDIKDADVRTWPECWTLEHKRTRVTTTGGRRGGQEGLDKTYAGALQRGGHGEGFRVSLLANCRISLPLGTKPTSSYSSPPTCEPANRPREVLLQTHSTTRLC